MPKGIAIEVWLAFLAYCGLVYQRTHASHDIYDHPTHPLPRPVVVRGSKDDEVPLLHMQTSCQAMGLQLKDFTAWQKKNIGKGGKPRKEAKP